jgi:hypothetical protein
MSDPVVHLDCGSCGQRVVVMPPILFAFIPEHAEVEAARQIAGLTSDEGERFAVADGEGSFTCPRCGQQWRLPERSGAE